MPQGQIVLQCSDGTTRYHTTTGAWTALPLSLVCKSFSAKAPPPKPTHKNCVRITTICDEVAASNAAAIRHRIHAAVPTAQQLQAVSPCQTVKAALTAAPRVCASPYHILHPSAPLNRHVWCTPCPTFNKVPAGPSETSTAIHTAATQCMAHKSHEGRSRHFPHLFWLRGAYS
jgi:hypothetical protein